MTMTERRDIQTWSVTVMATGEDVLTIGHNHLAGVENIDEYADVVRQCADHLLAFIGTQPAKAAEG